MFLNDNYENQFNLTIMANLSHDNSQNRNIPPIMKCMDTL